MIVQCWLDGSDRNGCLRESRRSGRIKPRCGASLLEMLIVIGILGLLVQMILPAVEMSREQARRLACSNNLRQLSVAVLNFESISGRLPPGSVVKTDEESEKTVAHPFHVSILPHLEDSAKYATYDTSRSWNDQTLASLEVLNSPIPSYQCPSDKTRYMLSSDNDDSNSVLFKEAKGNYGVNWGSKHFTDQYDDEFFDGQDAEFESAKDRQRAPFDKNFGARLAQLTDGTTRTLMLMELVQAPSELHQLVDRRARIWNHTPGTYQITTRFPPNSRKMVSDQSKCVHRPSLKIPCFRMDYAAQMRLSSRSWHLGGVNTIRCDGSQHFVVDDIDERIWRQLSIRNDGQ